MTIINFYKEIPEYNVGKTLHSADLFIRPAYAKASAGENGVIRCIGAFPFRNVSDFGFVAKIWLTHFDYFFFIKINILSRLTLSQSSPS